MSARQRKPGAGLEGLPPHMRLLSQRVTITTAPNLHHMQESHEDGEEGHAHRAYGVYDEGAQVITLDDSLGFERARETYLHESLHGMLAISQLDGLIEGQAEGLAEHIVSALSPVLLAWVRDNPDSVAYLQTVQG